MDTHPPQGGIQTKRQGDSLLTINKGHGYICEHVPALWSVVYREQRSPSMIQCFPCLFILHKRSKNHVIFKTLILLPPCMFYQEIISNHSVLCVHIT